MGLPLKTVQKLQLVQNTVAHSGAWLATSGLKVKLEVLLIELCQPKLHPAVVGHHHYYSSPGVPSSLLLFF